MLLLFFVCFIDIAFYGTTELL